MTKTNAIVAITNNTAIATPAAVDHIGFLSNILIIAHPARIGALVNICNH